MKCPNCGYKFNGGDLCPGCGENAALIAKAHNISVKLYNQGLEQARARDLSGAVDSLKRSILFDKNNINARNVLGLVYYELGQMADALVQWIVSQNIHSEKNPAVEYLNNYGENIRNSEKMEDSVSLYNEALEYVKQKNDDLAIIRLKKALDINSKFVQALNLLSLCYLMRGRNNEALDIVNRVLRLDVNNPIALGYYRQLCPDKSRPDPRKTKNDMRYATYYVPNDNIGNKKIAKSVNPVIMFAIGCICTIIVMVVLVMPSYTEEYKTAYETASSEYDQLKKDYDELTASTNTLTEELSKENEELQNQLNTINARELQERVNVLTTVSDLYENDQLIEAAQQLMALSTDGFDNDTINRYNSLRQDVLPGASEEYYDLGLEAERQGNEEEAKTNYNNCLSCALSDTEVKYNAMLRLGIIAEEAGDYTTAKDYYQNVVDNHPSSAEKNEAQERYDNIVQQEQ